MFPIDLIRRQKKTYKKVLSLDGGGVRGLASVIFLKELEKSLGKTVFELFDFFIGTSAGGLNALHFTINKTSAEELEDFIKEQNA